MAPNTAARLARRLLQIYGESDEFYFEVDTAENASLLATKIQALGWDVSLPSYGVRLNVMKRQKEGI
jgi:hypothetical protein